MVLKKDTIQIEAKSLANNPLHDPVTREVIIYSSDETRRGGPLLVGLSPFGSNHRSFVTASPLVENMESILSRMYERGMLKNATIAIPDTFTGFGGNQYLNSSAVGNYEDFIIQDLIPHLKNEYDPTSIGIFGKGSGGFGAYTLAVRNPGTINAFASHSMDAGFEYAYIPDFSPAMAEFRRFGGPSAWFSNYQKSYNRLEKNKVRALSIINYAAFYSPNPSSTEMGIDFPFNWNTGEFKAEIWDKWLSFDPARTIENYFRQIEMLNFIYMDVGIKDEYDLVWGSRSIEAFLSERGVKHVYEEYEAGHFGVLYRIEKSLALMTSSIS